MTSPGPRASRYLAEVCDPLTGDERTACENEARRSLNYAIKNLGDAVDVLRREVMHERDYFLLTAGIIALGLTSILVLEFLGLMPHAY